MSKITVMRRGATTLAVVAATAGLAACGGDDAETTTAAGSAAGVAATGAAKRGSLVVADAAIANSLDPDGPAASFLGNLTAVNNTYDGLVALKSKDNPAELGGGKALDADGVDPALAESWKIEGSQATFTLRQGVESQYGNEFTADDVVWTYRRNVGMKATGTFLLSSVAHVTSVKAVGRYRVRFTTDGPSPLLLLALTQAYVKPMDSTEVKKHVTSGDKWAAKWLTNNSAGFGAYTVSQYASGRTLSLAPAKGYWGTAPQNAIKMISIPDSASRFSAVEKGDVNMALGLAPAQVKDASTKDALHLYRVRGNTRVTLFPNAKVKALNNAKVRQALEYATPQDQIVKSVYLGYGFPLKGITPPYYAGFDPKYWPYTYDVAKAKALMKEAGYPNGFSVDMHYSSESATLGSLAPILQSAYEQIGVKIKLVAQPASQIITRIFGKKDLPIFISDTASNVLPDISNIGASWQTGSFGNVTNYSNEAFDAAYAKSLSTLDQAERLKAFATMQQILGEQAPAVEIAGIETVAVTSANVGGYSWSPDQSQSFKTLTVGEGAR